MALTIAKLPTIHNRSVGDIGCYLIHDSSITSGIPDTANVANPGSGYHVSDVITIVGGNNDATFRVDTIFGSGVGNLIMISAGTQYVAGNYNTTVSPSGGTGCTLTIPSVHGDITYPTKVPILDLGGIKESIDSLGNGKTILDNVDVTLKEDYSVHSEGFWHKMLTEFAGTDVNGFPSLLDFELMFTVFEGTDETFVFRGKIYRIESPEEEYYLDNITTPNVVVRGVKLRLVSSLTSLQNVSIEQLRVEINTHLELRTLASLIDGTHWNVYMVSYKIILASMLKCATGEAYNVSNVVNNSTDIQIQGTSELPLPYTYIDWLNGYLDANYLWPSGFGINTQSSEQITSSWYDTFSNAFDLLVHICQGWGVVPRYSFGTAAELIDANSANNTSRIVLNSRGSSGGTQVTMTGKLLTPASSSSPVQPTFTTDTQNKPRTFSVNNPAFADDALLYSYNGLIGHQEVPPIHMSFDMELNTDFKTSGVPYPQYYLHFIDESGNYYPVFECQYWNCKTSAYVIVTGDGLSDPTCYLSNLAGALFEYFYNRFTPWRCQFEREYSSIKVNNGSTVSQRNCRTLIRHVINDGVSSRNVYGTEVEKDLLNGKVRILWVQE